MTHRLKFSRYVLPNIQRSCRFFLFAFHMVDVVVPTVLVSSVQRDGTEHAELPTQLHQDMAKARIPNP